MKEMNHNKAGKILIVNSAEAAVTEFTAPVKAILMRFGFSSEIIEYRNCPATRMEAYGGIILSGSPRGDDIVEHHQPWFQWIKTYDKPVFGICAGHHVVGSMYGAEYLRSKEPELGDVIITILKDDPIFKGMPRQFRVRQMHNDSITLPEGFVHLARSETCFNQIMRYVSKPLYSVQFHPEYLNPEILLNFAGLCRENNY